MRRSTSVSSDCLQGGDGECTIRFHELKRKRSFTKLIHNVLPDAVALLVGLRKNFSTLSQVARNALGFAFFELIVGDELGRNNL
jgi:hypothetical protein